jgi:long-subunit acyl-CoA synthetase (AMP-forming)
MCLFGQCTKNSQAEKLNYLRVIAGKGFGVLFKYGTIQRVLEELGWEFIQLYGLTETGPLTDAESHAGGVGQSRFFRKITVAWTCRRAGAGYAELKIAPDGEVLARSSRIFKSYWSEPQATAAAPSVMSR